MKSDTPNLLRSKYRLHWTYLKLLTYPRPEPVLHVPFCKICFPCRTYFYVSVKFRILELERSQHGKDPSLDSFIKIYIFFVIHISTGDVTTNIFTFVFLLTIRVVIPSSIYLREDK